MATVRPEEGSASLDERVDMAEAIVCPNCRKAFRFKAELVGKRTKCPSCGVPFVAQAPGAAARRPDEPVWEPGPEIPLATFAEEATNPPPVPQIVARPRPPKPPRRPLEALTDRQRAVLKLGFTFIAFGVLALVLPLFGLQFRKLEKLGENAWIAGPVFITLGGVICGLVMLRRYVRVFKWMALIAGGGVAAFVVLCIVVLVVVGPRRGGARSTSNPPAPGLGSGSGSAAQARGRSSPSAHDRSTESGRPRSSVPGSTADSQGPERPSPRSSGRRSEVPRPGDSPWPAYEGMVRQHGAQAVVRIEITGGGSRIHSEVSKWYLGAFSSHPRPARFTSSREGVIYLVMAPVEDLDELVRKITFGSVTSVDKEERIIHVGGQSER
jgi:hypothetical protein